MTSAHPDRGRWLAANLARERSQARGLAGRRAVGAFAGLEAG
jgi:hypothetical protein